MTLGGDTWTISTCRRSSTLRSSVTTLTQSVHCSILTLPPGLFSWERLGHPGIDGSESTLWAGTEGANTACHQDTYGENLVCQLAGTKVWTLFSPADSDKLRPSRVPYEESSVYSLVNIQHLERNSESVLEQLAGVVCYSVTLEPGDVLFVPHHWWHQVNTTSSWSLSVNTWLPHPEDDTARLAEATVRWQLANTLRLLDTNTRRVFASTVSVRSQQVLFRRLILNPNEEDLADTPIEELSELIKQAKHQHKPPVSEEEYFSFKYDGEVEKVTGSPLSLPASSLDPESVGGDIFSSSLVKVLNCLTDKTVIAQAVNNILRSDL